MGLARCKWASSLLVSTEERSNDKELQDKRWTDSQKLASWVPMKQARRHQSSILRGSSLETISELSQLSFVEDTLEADRWNSGSKANATASRMPLTIPERQEGNYENSHDADDSGRKDQQGHLRTTDEPISVPQRRLSPPPEPTPAVNECNNRQDFSKASLMDSGIPKPQRKLSPIKILEVS